MKKYQWDKKRIIKTCVYLALGFILLQGNNHLKIFKPDWRYPQQLVWMLMVASFILCFLNLRKLIPKAMREDFWRGARWIIGKVGGGIRRLNQKIRRLLGIPDPVKRIRGRDERSFEFDMDNSLMRRFQTMKNQLRWRDLDNNADRIRFIYIKYIARLIRKGKKYDCYATPLELQRFWKINDEDGFMFGLYTDARYSGGMRPVSDDEVDRSLKLVKQLAKE